MAKKTAKKTVRTPEGQKDFVWIVRSLKTGAFTISSSTVKKPTGKHSKLPSFIVERSSETGGLIFNGTKASQLINKHPQVKIQRASVKPKHLSTQKIAEMIKSMKVA